MSRETVQPADDMKAVAGVRGAVVVAHGGAEVSTEPVTPLDPAMCRSSRWRSPSGMDSAEAGS